MIQHLIFDFDGTLWDCSEAYLKSIKVALANYGIHDFDSSEIVVGLPVERNFSRIVKDNEAEIQRLSAVFRDVFFDHDQALSKPYQSAHNTLMALVKSGHKVSIASHKRQNLLSKIVKAHFTDVDFHKVVGSVEGEKLGKENLIEKCLIKRMSNCYIGDTLDDMQASGKLSVPFIHAAYGFQNEFELSIGTRSIQSIDEVLNMYSQ